MFGLVVDAEGGELCWYVCRVECAPHAEWLCNVMYKRVALMRCVVHTNGDTLGQWVKKCVWWCYSIIQYLPRPPKHPYALGFVMACAFDQVHTCPQTSAVARQYLFQQHPSCLSGSSQQLVDSCLSYDQGLTWNVWTRSSSFTNTWSVDCSLGRVVTELLVNL